MLIIEQNINKCCVIYEPNVKKLNLTLFKRYYLFIWNNITTVFWRQTYLYKQSLNREDIFSSKRDRYVLMRRSYNNIKENSDKNNILNLIDKIDPRIINL